ncbi:MAG: cytidylate kinase family protein [Oscillospiraceae bacterium]|nr:cytidylate kinase family protein [Oscillospiraceae bacterium]
MPIRISITGSLGSGKSTVCKERADRYALTIFSTGTVQREIAVEMGMTTFELNRYMEAHPEIDRKIDDGLIRLSDSTADMAIDSRMAWHFVRDTYKVFLVTDESVAARRVMADKRGPSEGYSDEKDAKAQLKARRASENRRYLQKYGVDCYDLRNYDLVIDTTKSPPAPIADLIMSSYGDASSRGEAPRLFISEFCLYPTRHAGEMSEAVIEKHLEALRRDKPVAPVEICSYDGFYFIREGHHRAAAFIKNDAPFIPCVLRSVDGASGEHSAASKRLFDADLIRAWEERNGFRFFSYPPADISA